VRPWKLVVAAALVGACTTKAPSRSIALGTPESIAAFRGQPAPAGSDQGWYLAVANARGDELKLVDMVDNAPVLAPVEFVPLSVPTGASPAIVASASLNDGGADALVAIPGGTAELQPVDTWTGQPKVVPGTIDLATLAPGTTILAIIGAPALEQVDGAWTPASGRARFVVSLTGGWIATVDATRGAGGEVVLGNPQLQALADRLVPTPAAEPFELVALALAPDQQHVYGACPESMDGIEGVAEIDVTQADPAAWTVRALSARAPTIEVAASDVHLWYLGSDKDDAYETSAVLRVYAAIAPGSCGLGRAIPCGIAILDPALGGLAADPAGEMPYLAPIRLPGLPTAIAISGPPANGDQNDDSPKWFWRPDAPAEGIVYLLRMAPATGGIYTNAMATVPTTVGPAYWLDLSRFNTPNNEALLRGLSTSGKAGVGVNADADAKVPLGTTGAVLGICSYFDPAATTCAWTLGGETASETPPTQPTTDPALVQKRVGVTPGYTSDDLWTLSYQDVLPGLLQKPGVVGKTEGGTLYAAIQVRDDLAEPPWVGVADVLAPELAIHVTAVWGRGDLVDVELEDKTVCTTNVPDDDPATGRNEVDFSTTAADLLPRDPASFPGGAIALAEPYQVSENGAIGSGSCANLGNGQQVRALVTVRASGLLLVGARTGYAGRPPLGQKYQLVYENEDALSCPPAPTAECGVTCRAVQCEQRVLALKARRLFYVNDVCPAPRFSRNNIPDSCVRFGLDAERFVYPNPTGPVIAFMAGSIQGKAVDGEGNVVRDPVIVAGTQLTFSTTSGMVPASRRPVVNGAYVGAQLPTDAVPFDRSVIPGYENDGVRFYVSYPSAEVLSFSPAKVPTDVSLIR
jgi:hypothetical protein